MSTRPRKWWWTLGGSRAEYTPLYIGEEPVERVSNFKYIGIHIAKDLTWTLHAEHMLKKSRQQLYFLRRLRKFKVTPFILKTFYSSAVESVLTGYITARHSRLYHP